MKIPQKMLNNGFSIPVFGLGTWQMGGRTERDLQNDDAADITAIQTAIELGVTHIDSAEAYANGYSETLVGQAIKEYDRSKLFLASKVSPQHFHRDDLLQAAEDSLKRLQTDYLDLYMLHRAIDSSIAEETMKAMNELVEKGLVKYIGVSNHNVSEFEEAQRYSKRKLVSNQLHYNLQIREIEHKGLLAYCQENDVMLVGWRPLQKGVLTQDVPDIVLKIAKKYDKTPTQVMINWLISQDNVVTLSKARDMDHLKENLGAVGWMMEKEDIALLRRDYPNQQTTSDTLSLH